MPWHCTSSVAPLPARNLCSFAESLKACAQVPPPSLIPRFSARPLGFRGFRILNRNICVLPACTEAMEATSGFVVVAALLLALVGPVAAGSIQGCGGFVEASTALAMLKGPGHPRLDYSHTTVELRTVDGLVKDRTQCAPNGYYFLPVYDKGIFLLRVKGPDGWSFEPNEVKVVVGQNGCNENEDINFWYTGFSVAGRVLGAVGGPSCSANGTGPAGVTVVLSTVTGDEIVSTLTSQGGIYNFENLHTGKYLLKARHPSLQVELKGEPEVEVYWSSVTVGDVFFVPGYKVEGSVVSQGNPVLGVQFYLHSDDTHEQHCPRGFAHSHSLPAHCHVTSGEDGMFVFTNVPCGRYKLVPFYKGENTIFDVSPGSVDLSVQHESIVLQDPFQVTGFSVSGRVVSSKGFGVGDAKVLINGVHRATSDPEGFYKLDQVTSTHYTIRVEKPHFKFSALDNFLVLPNMAFVPDIYSTLFSLCGSVVVLDNALAGKRHVQLTHGPDTGKLQIRRADEKGVFCFEVPEGEYRLSPLTTIEERAAGLLFSPPFRDVIVEAPVLNASFTQAQASIAGTVRCKAQCSPSIVVSLFPLLKIDPTCTDLSKVRMTNLSSCTDSFVFENILPGRYRLEVEHKPSGGVEMLDDDWCWEQKHIDVEVGASDVVGLNFVQKGFWMLIESSHAADAFTLQPHKEAVPLQIKKGLQRVCLEHPGVHELHFLWPCVFFGALSFTHDTVKPQILRLVGQKYVLNGQIHIDSRLYPQANKLRTSVFVDIRQQDGKILDLQKRAHLLREANATEIVAIYDYTYWADVGDELIFAPRHKRGTPGLDVDEPDFRGGHEKGLLFYPASQQVRVEADGCQPEIPVFHGRPGVILRGNVVPALEGVSISIIADAVSHAGSFKEGDVVLRTSTSEDGVFVAGPLFDDTTYSLRAEKVGYYLRPLGNNSFACQQLGQIVVEILPGHGAEIQLPEVLLSLSGDDGYRKNSVTGSGGGLTFGNLFPGNFFLRPFLKEYSFSPSAEAIDVGSGEVKFLRFVARRVAYSVLGTVTSLSGRLLEGVYIAARAQGGESYEETVTDAEGRYRLRGLLPQSSYNITVVVRSGRGAEIRAERAIPTSVSVKVMEEDVADVKFVVFEQPSTATLTGVAEGQDGVETRRWRPHLVVEVKAAADISNVQTKRIAVTNFFEFGGLGNRKYVLRFIPDLPDQTHVFLSDSVEVDLETKNYVHVEPLKFVVNEGLHKQELTSAPVLPIVAAVLVVVLFANMSRFRDVYEAVGGSSTAMAGKKGVKKTALRKKTY